MGKILVEKMIPSLEKMPIPSNPEATPAGRTTYEIGLEKVDEFRGDPKTLVSALRTFQTSDSQPYTFAGVAYVLLVASREGDGSYAQEGLDAAMHWLEKAQETAPDEVDINMIEAFVYIYSGRYDDARLVIDYLKGLDPTSYFVLRAEIAFWLAQEKLKEAVYWFQKGIEAANTVPRKLRLRTELGDCYLEFGLYDKALEVYQEAVHFDKSNPWLWHNMSIAFWHKEDFREAARCNKHALDLLDFPDAREMEQALRSKLGTGGLMGRLFGR